MAMTTSRKHNQPQSRASGDRRSPHAKTAPQLDAYSSANPSGVTTDQSVIFLGEADYRLMEEAENRPLSDMPGLVKLMSEKYVLE